jgi:hypothetical protein
LLVSIFSSQIGAWKWPGIAVSVGTIIPLMIYLMGIVKQAESEYYAGRISADAAASKQEADDWWHRTHSEVDVAPSQRPAMPGHHSGEGFLRITEAAKDPTKLVEAGAPLNFQMIATNTGQEAVTNEFMFSSFLPVGEFSPDLPVSSDLEVINRFHALREKEIGRLKKSGVTGETMGPGEQRMNIIGTNGRPLSQKNVDSFYAKRTKIYLLSWAEWKTLNGITETNEQCVWLEPPDPPRPDPDKLWWNECDQPSNGK